MDAEEPNRRRSAAGLPLLVLLLAATCATYLNALWAGFQFDDFKVIVDNPVVHTWQAWLDDMGQGIRPLLKLSYTLNWVSGWGVAGFHLTNIAVHLCNVLLVFALTRRFVRLHPRLPQQQAAIPLFVALLFALHPIHTEAVTYVSGRSIALMTLFYLAGLLAYVSGREGGSKALGFLLTPLCFVAALGVKETAVTFPLALLVWSMACGEPLRAALRRQWPAWAVLLLAAAYFLGSGSYVQHMERSAALNSLQGNLATQSEAFAYLLKQWAFPLWLNMDPDLKVAHGLAGHIPQLFLLAAVFVMMLLAMRRRPWIGFGMAWVLIQLVPLYLFLPRLDVANERQMYLVSWPLALAVTAELAIWLKPKVFTFAVAALALAFAGLTAMRNQAYQDEVALWEDTVVKSPGKARVHNNLGYAYMQAGRRNEAEREFRVALGIDPEYYKARNNLDIVQR
ncbi:MAG: hypothetical protein HY846_06700 [Nitrosomonadales bacterium]|nr:hypothetical protein [Nitrosomonadales bacterium]